MAIDEKGLTKGEVRKLNALRKSIGDKLADEAFSKWLIQKTSAKSVDHVDPVAETIAVNLVSTSMMSRRIFAKWATNRCCSSSAIPRPACP